jgi:hypothetical protein
MRLKKSVAFLIAAAMLGWQVPVNAQIVPGTGQELSELADDFEDPNWTFILNLPKASTNIDKVDRQPSGYSTNGKWFESTYRGTPDFVKRVETPAGGIPGSTGALALQTLYSGIPGQLSNKFQQDDLIANVSQKLGYMLPATWTPSYVVRIYVPPFEQWEQRVGSSFGFRADCQTIINKPTKVGRFFRTGGTTKEMEQYWPGFFFQYNGKSHPQHPTQNTATILIRSGARGEDIPGPVITSPGWWTLGMTITSDGKVHYYGHEGVANLTARDHLYSNHPYGYKCLQSSTYFFNVVNQDDGRSWSTRWIIDDPKVYVATRPYTAPAQTAQVPAQRISQVKPVEPETPVAPETPATPAATSASPQVPATPATLAPPVTPPSVPRLQSAPTAPPKLELPSAPAAATPGVGAEDSVTPTAPAAKRSILPELSTKPSPVIPVKAGSQSQSSPAPDLLPDDVTQDSGPIAAPVTSAPVISAPGPAPAPLALPDEDAPMLPPEPTVQPSTPPAPAMPQ